MATKTWFGDGGSKQIPVKLLSGDDVDRLKEIQDKCTLNGSDDMVAMLSFLAAKILDVDSGSQDLRDVVQRLAESKP